MSENRTELIDLVKLDYEQTTKVVGGVVGTVYTIRGWGLTLWSGLVGLYFGGKGWPPAVAALIVLLGMAALDLYHSCLYKTLLARARRLEEILAASYAAHGRGRDDPVIQQQLQISLEKHTFGLWREQERISLRKALLVRPLGFFAFVYALALFATIAILLVPLAAGMAQRVYEKGGTLPTSTVPVPSPSAPAKTG